MSKIDWSDLEIVSQVARLGTLGAAAEALGIHYSTVMRRIDRFQKDHRVRLFERSNDGLRVAPDAASLIERIAAIASMVAEVERELNADDGVGGTVKLTIPAANLGRLLMPGVAALTREHPQLDLKITATNEFLPVGSSDADIALRVLRGDPDENLVARSAGFYCTALYATRTYLDTHDPFESPHTCQWVGWDDPTEDMLEWIANSPFPEIPVGPRLSHVSLQIEAARQHLGIARLPCFFGDTTPDLVRLPGIEPEPGHNIWVVTHPSIATLPKIRATMDYLVEMIRAQAPVLQGVAPEKAEPTSAVA